MADKDDDPQKTAPGADLAEALGALVAAELAVLQAEMAALRQLVPGLPPPGTGDPVADDAEIEANFDNMPV